MMFEVAKRNQIRQGGEQWGKASLKSDSQNNTLIRTWKPSWKKSFRWCLWCASCSIVRSATQSQLTSFIRDSETSSSLHCSPVGSTFAWNVPASSTGGTLSSMHKNAPTVDFKHKHNGITASDPLNSYSHTTEQSYCLNTRSMPASILSNSAFGSHHWSMHNIKRRAGLKDRFARSQESRARRRARIEP